MAYATILAQIKTYMESVTSIGNVHDYVRWNKDWPAMLTMFKITSPSAQIRFWDISRVASPEQNKVSKENLRTHTFRIRGFMSLDDSAATEKTFQALLETVCTKFRNVPTLNSTAANVDPLQINTVGHVMVGDVLCHMAECTLTVEEQITWQE
jgi:hypothetical protein